MRHPDTFLHVPEAVGWGIPHLGHYFVIILNVIILKRWDMMLWADRWISSVLGISGQTSLLTGIGGRSSSWGRGEQEAR